MLNEGTGYVVQYCKDKDYIRISNGHLEQIVQNTEG